MASTQQQWEIREADSGQVDVLVAHLHCPRPIASLLVSRGIIDLTAAQAFFHPSLDDLHDPMLMLGMAPAVARIQQAVRNAEPILIYGDYDVDGTTATVLLKTAIERIASKEVPAIVTYHVPHRLREGYGMQTNILGQASAAGVRLVISVDTGIRAFAAADEAKALGMDLIVTDHHLPEEARPDGRAVPEAIAVINPAQQDCLYPFKFLCGASVAFKLAHALLLAAAAEAPDPEVQRLKLQRNLIPSFLKLVAIATIADSVPLEGENRVIAALGLRELRNPVQPGLRALMQVAEIPLNRPPTATEVGFRLAPRINAAGRMDVASDVVDLFLTKDPALAFQLATKLDALNTDRRATEATALAAIELQLLTLLTSEGTYPAECIILDDSNWHRGVLGILASRIVDRTHRPALVLTHEDGQAHGSGRSVPGFHLLDALTAAQTADPTLFTRFGGHAHAVGFSLPTVNLAQLRTLLRMHAAPLLTPPLLHPALYCDAEVPFADLTLAFYDWLNQCAPFGIGNREPILFTSNVALAAPVRILKEKHICLQLQHESTKHRWSALGWSRTINWPERCDLLALQQGSRIDVVYRLKSKSNPQYPGLEMELVDLRLTATHPATPTTPPSSSEKTPASF